MQEVLIVGAARTPIGINNGVLATQRAQDLAAHSMKEAVARAGIDSNDIDISIYGQAMQSSLPANIARHGWLLAGFSEKAAGFSINTLGAGALQAIISGYNKLFLGEYDGVITGGVESYSMAPKYIFHPRYSFGENNNKFEDPKIGVEVNAQPADKYGIIDVAALADLVAKNYGVSREKLDEYAVTSNSRAVQAVKDGLMSKSIVPLVKKIKKTETIIEKDEGPEETTLDRLLVMPAKNEGGTATEGNTAKLADGAASIVMLSRSRASQLGCNPLAKITGYGIAAGNPIIGERIVLWSIEKALQMAGKNITEIDFIDIYEPSAAHAIVISKNLSKQTKGQINSDGGTLAYGNAGAANGGIMVVNMIYKLERTAARIGLVNVMALGGQSLSVVVERI